MEPPGGLLSRKALHRSRSSSRLRFPVTRLLGLLEVGCLVLCVLFIWRRGASNPLCLTRFVTRSLGPVVTFVDSVDTNLF
ncbi:UNVERIFIED_CONTAM: hypothetical protein Sradi_2641600 [Sesamum radiatum]|uniref:Uncharacterized protein n=1 Tax=Sesamum radiatum TaxID=300843 RepID=A0AAW2S541_SESRA